MAADNKYKYSKAYFKILNLILSNPKETVFVICGGQGAGKTISILELVIQSLLSTTKEASVVSSELSKMKRTVIRDYKKIGKDWGILGKDDFNRSESKHEYPNDSYIDFLGADVSDIGKGFRRDIIYINEADKLDIDTAVQFISRAGLTLIDYNPDSLFWGNDYVNDNNFIILTFEDNEYLPLSEVNSILDYKTKGFHNPTLPFDLLFKETNIKSAYWANKWRVYGLGLVGNLDGVVFDDWSIIDTLPPLAKYVKSGLDFGYTNDPTTIIDKYELNSDPIYDEFLYEKGLSNVEIAKRIKSDLLRRTIIADSAEPKSVDEIKIHGINIQGALKGPDSIKFGIQKIQKKKFYITARSKHLIEELQKYTWAKDKMGNPTNKPIESWNHCIDPMRYIEEEEAKKLTINSSGLGGYKQNR